jgi:hypothetical protein
LVFVRLRKVNALALESVNSQKAQKRLQRLAEIAALLEKMQVQAELPEEDSTVFCIGIQLTSNTMISGLHFQVAQDSQLPETPWNLNQSQCQ